MPIDPRIAMGVRPIQIESPINALAKAAELQGIQQHNALSQAKLDAHRAQAARSGQLNTLLQSGASPDELLRGGFMEEALALREDSRKGAKSAADIAEANLSAKEKEFKLKRERAQYQRQLLGGVNDPVAAQQWYANAVKDGDIGMQEAQAAIQRVPQDPAGFQRWKAEQEAMGLTVEQRMEQMWKDKNFRLNLRKQDHTEANDAQQIAISRGNLGVAQANVGLRRQELEHSKGAPKGVIVQTDQGPVLADPRTGATAPLTGADGKPLGPKLKDVPAPMQKAMVENVTNLQRAERALALIQGKDVGEMKGDKEATGWKGFLPPAILDRADPQGVDARAAIADLGSLVIHDRSGAAVSAAEFPRLAPFIPGAKDDNATVEKKLKRFVQVYKEEIENTKSMYGPDNGFKPFGGKEATKPAARTVVRTGKDASGRKVVQYSDGSIEHAD